MYVPKKRAVLMTDAACKRDGEGEERAVTVSDATYGVQCEMITFGDVMRDASEHRSHADQRVKRRHELRKIGDGNTTSKNRTNETTRTHRRSDLRD